MVKTENLENIPNVQEKYPSEKLPSLSKVF